MDQDDLPLSDTRPPEQRILEFEQFADSIGRVMLEKMVSIAENARIVMRLMRGEKNASHTAAALVITNNYLEEFCSEFPEMSRFEVLKYTSEAAHFVFEHLEFLRSQNGNYQSGMLRRKERLVAIKQKEISSKFPPNFSPPPCRKRVRPDSLPDEEWLRAVAKDPSRLTKLRRDNEKAWDQARRSGKAPKLADRQLKLF